MTREDEYRKELRDAGVRWSNFWKLVGAIVLIIVVVTAIGVPLGWYRGTAKLTGFQHSDEQTTAVLDDWQGLQAAACNAVNARTSPQQSGDPTLVEDPALAYKATYRRIQVDYNRRMSNFFEAALTRHLPIHSGISGLPREAPSLRDAQGRWC